MNISVFGLGYVGTVSAVCLARDGHQVIGCEIDPEKLRLMNAGTAPVVEPEIPELFSEVMASGRLRVTDDAAAALADSELSFLCVGTPSLADGVQDTSALRRLAANLGNGLRHKSGFHIFVLRSTVLPGTTDDFLAVALEQHSGKKVGTDFDVGFQPEFLREGSSVADHDAPPYTVIGTRSERVAGAVREIYGSLPCAFHMVSASSAELLKYASNAFHAAKISFANEIGRIAHARGIDGREVMRLLAEDRKLNVAPAYLRPGFAFGGPCLPKDLRAIVRHAAEQDVATPLLASLLSSNQVQIDRALEIVLATGAKDVGLLGLAFKHGTDDLRESPLLDLAAALVRRGIDVRAFDPDLDTRRQFGANRRHANAVAPALPQLLCDAASDVFAHCDVVVVGHHGAVIRDAVGRYSAQRHTILDLSGRIEPKNVKARVVTLF